MDKQTIFVLFIMLIFILILLLDYTGESFVINPITKSYQNKYRLIFVKTKEYYLIYLKYPDTKYNKIYKIYKNKLNNIIF